MFVLDGKVALVTGCDSGLGHGMALALAGCDVGGINVVPAEATAALIAEVGQRFHDIRADLRSAVPVKLVEQAVAAFGRIDILVNNAGIIRRAARRRRPGGALGTAGRTHGPVVFLASAGSAYVTGLRSQSMAAGSRGRMCIPLAPGGRGFMLWTEYFVLVASVNQAGP